MTAHIPADGLPAGQGMRECVALIPMCACIAGGAAQRPRPLAAPGAGAGLAAPAGANKPQQPGAAVCQLLAHDCARPGRLAAARSPHAAAGRGACTHCSQVEGRSKRGPCATPGTTHKSPAGTVGAGGARGLSGGAAPDGGIGGGDVGKPAGLPLWAPRQLGRGAGRQQGGRRRQRQADRAAAHPAGVADPRPPQ